MKTQLHLLTIAISFSMDAHSQNDTFVFSDPSSDEIPEPSGESAGLSENPDFIMMIGGDENIFLDSTGNELYFRIPICPNGITLDYVPEHYPAFTSDGTPYWGELLTAEMPDSIFNIYLDSLKEADFCFNDSINAEEGSLENKIIDFTYNSIGRKVGTGICFDLIKEAGEYANLNWLEEKWEQMEKYEVDSSEIQEGDVIRFENVLYADGGIVEAHVGIVYRIFERGKISYAEQNVGTSEESEIEFKQYYRKYVPIYKDSRVVISDLNLKEDIVSGLVKFYRFE